MRVFELAFVNTCTTAIKGVISISVVPGVVTVIRGISVIERPCPGPKRMPTPEIGIVIKTRIV